MMVTLYSAVAEKSITASNILVAFLNITFRWKQIVFVQFELDPVAYTQLGLWKYIYEMFIKTKLFISFHFGHCAILDLDVQKT